MEQQQREENKIAARYYDLPRYERPEGDLDPFATSGNRRNEIIIGGENNDWDLYCTGYWRAADALIRYLTQVELSARRDYSRYWESMGYAILFLYRHYLELRLKELFIACGGRLEAITSEHSLLRLWGAFLEQYCLLSGKPLEEVSKDKDIETAGKIIAQFNEIDEKSQIFRYPIDKRGQVKLQRKRIDMVRLREMLGWTSQFLDGWSIGLAELRSRHE